MSLKLSISEQDLTLVGSELCAKITDSVAKRLSYGGVLELAEVNLVTREEIQALNKEHRGLDEATDVLSFPTSTALSRLAAKETQDEVLLGTIIICPEKAEIYKESLAELVLHGLLHLYGFDHETDLESWLALERPIVAELGEPSIVGIVTENQAQ